MSIIANINIPTAVLIAKPTAVVIKYAVKASLKLINPPSMSFALPTEKIPVPITSTIVPTPTQAERNNS